MFFLYFCFLNYCIHCALPRILGLGSVLCLNSCGFFARPALASGGAFIHLSEFTAGLTVLIIMSSSERLAALRALLVEHSLDALIVPTEDAHQSEYVAPRDKRRQFISNFSGSAGTVVVTATEACLWTDGRYWLQAQQQLEPAWTLMRMGDSSVPTVGEWLAQRLPDARVGFDPSVTSVGTHRRLALEAGCCHLTPTPVNLIDLLWTDRPARSESLIAIHALEYAGRSVADKLASVRSSFAAVGAGIGALQQCGAHVITSLDCVAWLFNLRGDDIPFNPVCAWQILIQRTWHFVPLICISFPLCFRFHRRRFFIRLRSSPRRRRFCLLMKIRSAMLCVRTSLPPVSLCGRMRRSFLISPCSAPRLKVSCGLIQTRAATQSFPPSVQIVRLLFECCGI